MNYWTLCILWRFSRNYINCWWAIKEDTQPVGEFPESRFLVASNFLIFVIFSLQIYLMSVERPMDIIVNLIILLFRSTKLVGSQQVTLSHLVTGFLSQQWYRFPLMHALDQITKWMVNPTFMSLLQQWACISRLVAIVPPRIHTWVRFF